MRAPLLERLAARGLQPRKVSTGRGDRGEEYASPCPVCGGRDRFRIWPEQPGGPACAKAGVVGTWFCRQEQKGGDVLEYLLTVERLEWAEACKELGIERTTFVPGRLPAMPKAIRKASFQPKPSALPGDIWSARAGKFVADAHAALLRTPRALAYLAERGLPEAAVRRYRLGYLAGEQGRKGVFRARSAWGLQPKEGKDGKPRTSMFIPRGIIIPAYGPAGQDGAPVRIRIRRPDGDVEQWGDKYMLVEGGCGRTTMLLGEAPRAVVVVEAELDAMLVHHAAGDLVGALAVLTNRGRPDATAHTALQSAASILVALDYDGPGADGWAWWRETYPQAKRWPVPAGKDPGDAFKQGEDLRAWILAGLPPVLAMEHAKARGAAQLSSVEQAPTASSAPAVAPCATAPAPIPSPAAAAASAPASSCGLQPDVMQTVLAFRTLWEGMPVKYVRFNSGGYEWQYPAPWGKRHMARLHELLRRFDATPTLWDYFAEHPARIITPDNLLCRARRSNANRPHQNDAACC